MARVEERYIRTGQRQDNLGQRQDELGRAAEGAGSEVVEPPLRPICSPRSANWLGDFVYGTIGTLAVVEGLTLDGSSLEGLEAVGAVLVGAISIWMAHGVSRLVAERAERGSALHLGDIVGEFRGTWPIIAAAFPATVVLVLAERHVLSVSLGLTVSSILGVAALTVAGISSARGPQRRLLHQVVYVATLTAAGAVIVVLEVAVHHL